MPDQDASQFLQIVKVIKANRERYAKLPLERQNSLYNAMFDRFVAPRLQKSGLSSDDMKTARNQWVMAITKPEGVKPLPEGFGVEKKKEGVLDKAGGFLMGAAAGTAGVTKTVAEWLNAKQQPDPVAAYFGKEYGLPSYDPVKTLGSAEHRAYEEATALSPKAASAGAAVGHQLPAFALFEAGAGAIPELETAVKAPKIISATQRAAKTAVGTIAMTPAMDEKTPGGVAISATANVILDALLGRMGGLGARKTKAVVDRLRSSGDPVKSDVANAVDSLVGTIAKEKFPGKNIQDLSPEQFDSVVKESQARQAAEQARQAEAKKAVKAAETGAKPKPLSPEEKAAQGALMKEKKAQERKEAAERSKQVTQRFAAYKKLYGNIPPEGSAHFEALKTGTGAAELLKAPEEKAVEAAKQGLNEQQVKTIAQGAPQVGEALQAVKALEASAPMAEAEKAELEKKAGRTLTDAEAVAYRKQNLEWESVQSLKAGKSDVAAKETAGIKDKIKKSQEKTPSLFNIDIKPVIEATSPEAFAKAKKEAMQQVVDQAKKLAGEGKVDKQKLLSEANKERERIRSLEAPKTFTKKTLDAQRKAEERKGTAGSVPVETISAQENISRPGDDPELEMLRDTMLSQIEDLNPKAHERVMAAIEGKDIKTQNAMIEKAIVALKSAKAAPKALRTGGSGESEASLEAMSASKGVKYFIERPGGQRVPVSAVDARGGMKINPGSKIIEVRDGKESVYRQ